jgi:nucleoside-diphosphate-sugar epimerase
MTTKSLQDALRIALASATPGQIRLLRVHFESPAGRATARDLATAVGYRSPHRATMQLGAFAHKVADMLDEQPPHWIMVLADIEGNLDARGEFVLTMKPEVRDALKELGWRPASPSSPQVRSL